MASLQFFPFLGESKSIKGLSIITFLAMLPGKKLQVGLLSGPAN